MRAGYEKAYRRLWEESRKLETSGRAEVGGGGAVQFDPPKFIAALTPQWQGLDDICKTLGVPDTQRTRIKLGQIYKRLCFMGIAETRVHHFKKTQYRRAV